MFDQMKNLKQMMSMLGDAQGLQQRMQEMQAELERVTVEGEAGAGAVRVTMNGKMRVLGVKLDGPMVASLAGAGDEADLAMIEELIVAATNDAMDKAQARAREHLSSLTGGLNLPGLDSLGMS